MRDAKEADVEGIMEVHLDCIQKICCHHYTQHQVVYWMGRQSLPRYTSFIKQSNDFVVVLAKEENNSVVGFGHMGKEVSGKFSSQVDFEVYGFYVSPRVSRKGVGRQLYGELERRALEQGGHGIGIISTLNAIPFYEACGFEVLEPCYHGDLQLECRCMEKKVAK